MITLGINAAFHDLSAALVKDGKVIAAVEEERFNRIKHGKRPLPFSAYELPFNAIDYCLKTAGITLKDVDYIGYSYDPELKIGNVSEDVLPPLPISPSEEQVLPPWKAPWDPLFYRYIKNAPHFLVGREKPLLPQTLKGTTTDEVKQKFVFVEHHLSHAASAFYPSPFEEAAVLTIDGQGENTSTAYWIGKGQELKKIAEVKMPNSLGILYERVTEYLGFLNSSDEYKVMALASYGKPEFLEQFRQIVRLKGNGQYEIVQPLTVENLEKIIGVKKRDKGEEFTKLHFDIAHSLQKVLEETVLELVKWLYAQTQQENLVMAGGVALNCVMNSYLHKKGPFKKIWVQPASGDAGTSLGAALWIDSQKRDHYSKEYTMDNVYLGPEYSNDQIEKILIDNKLNYKKLANPAEEVGQILADNKIIGWFQGRAEFGPRALGNRSILASPKNPEMQAFLNHIKDREDFRPVAPVVLEEEAPNWFKDALSAPFMLFVFDVMDNAAQKIPAVRHTDGTARVQTVNQEQNQKYYDLIKAFFDKTGVPVLINTSFNKDEPMVLTPDQAIRTFFATPLDALVIGDFLLEKK